ncbi:hypothetical protein AWB99_14190 [Mycolicibacterium confluentis]|nr:hypothetical protein AWB99_14190 [Mycolicibacterium confluentis]
MLADRIEHPISLSSPERHSAAEYLADVEAQNRSVWVTASAYGLSTSRADAFASDTSILAAAGILGHSRIGAQYPPIVPPGTLGLRLTGYVMAVAALHGLHLRREQESPVHLDVSAQSAVIATGLTLEMGHALSHCPDQGGSARYGAPSGFFTCLDGAVYVLVLEQHQWQAFQKALVPAVDSVPSLEDARENADFVNAQMTQWASTRTAEQCEQTLQAAGVPCTAVNSVETFVERARKVGRPVNLTGPDAVFLPAQVTTVPAGDGGGRADGVIGLSDLRVLDAGHVLAIPLGAAWLGAMGAQVTKLEDPNRLDIYRRRGPFAEGEPGVNRSAYFNQLNFCKTRLDVAVGVPGEQIDLDSYDVVLHNLTPRRAQAVGVDPESVLTGKSARLLVSSSGFGGTGEWSGYRAYGHNIHAFSGLVDATLDPRGEMGDIGTPWADPLTSVAVSAMVLAWSLSPERDAGVGIDVSMAELTAAQIAELIGTEPAEAYRAPEVGGDFFLRMSDAGQMLAVSLRSGEEVNRFQDAIGRSLPAIQTKGQLIEFGSDDFTVDDVLAERLLDAGFAVSTVLTAHDLAVDSFVRSTGLFQNVNSSDLGDYHVTGLPWQVAGRGAFALRAAPERPSEAD